MTTALKGRTDPQNIAEIQLNELNWPWGTVLFYAFEPHSRALDIVPSSPGEYWSSAAYKAFEADNRAIEVLRPSSQAVACGTLREAVFDSDSQRMEFVQAMRSARAELDSTNTRGQPRLDGAADWGLNNCKEVLAANVFVCKMSSMMRSSSLVLEIDPVIQVRADLLEAKSTLKHYKRDSSEVYPVNEEKVSDFLNVCDIWESYVKMQILSLEKMDHRGWNVYKRGFSGCSPELFCSSTVFVGKLAEWFRPNQDSPTRSETEFRYQMGFKRRSLLTTELLSMLKINTECCLFCTGRPPMMFLRDCRIEAIEANTASCKAICKKLRPDWLDRGVARRCLTMWTLIAWGWVIAVLVAVSFVAKKNPADRENWFELTTDCVTVFATLLASVVTLFGMGGGFAEEFLSALRGAKTWRFERHIARDLGKDGLQCLKMELTNSIANSDKSSELHSIWRHGNSSFSVSPLQGFIEMSTGLKYTSKPNDESKTNTCPISNAGSLIVGRKSAYNFFTGQHYAVEVVSGRLIRLAEVDKHPFSSLIGCQESYEIR